MGISTHILDTALGRPAAEVPVTLAVMANGSWSLINDAVTDADGRCKQLLPATQPLQAGVYRVHFETAAYFGQRAALPYSLAPDRERLHHLPRKLNQ